MNEHLSDNENVARAVFSPQMISTDGSLLLSAFALRVFKDGTKENYISVSRMSADNWMSDIKKIPQYKNRLLYGYAALNVGKIRRIELSVDDFPMIYDVVDCSTPASMTHAGIVVQLSGVTITGGHNNIFDVLQIDEPEDFVMMAIQAELLEIANPNLVRF
ncbi:MAG: hypothetical protein IIU03_01835 [Bacteroidales bacterium]|nr:hypothetical protein [Bacteroidales bacterium]